MPVNHTGNTGFHSKSAKAESTRWLVTSPPLLRGYVIHCANRPHLNVAWWLVGVVQQDAKLWLRCYAIGNDVTVSLDAADVGELLAEQPTINEEIPVAEQAVALRRMERGASMFMHRMLDPVPVVAHVWRRIACEENPKNVLT